MDAILWTADQAAQALGVAKSQVYKLTARGELPVVRVGHLLRYPADLIQQWVRERAQGGYVETTAPR